MTKLVWKIRCAMRFWECSDVSWRQAWYLAGACWENDDGDGMSPADAADSEMSYWEP